mmetsp:Transcript_113909/g.332852  ORF Transcript_113909/g.332852 Transcript_113909/m.332852 type:complete len:347 (-) Transcript_113909:58-1098(-)
MAYGLHTIAHKNYSPDGSGRDWFFIGDFEYRNGRKTPLGQHTGKRPTRPPGEKKGAPAEVAFQRRVLAGSGKAKTLERWRRLQQEQVAHTANPKQQMAMTAARTAAPAKFGKGDTFAATSWELGSHPSWRGSHYELASGTELEAAGALRSASSPALEPGPGDHTRGIRSSAHHFSPESWKLGNDPNYSGKRFDLPNGTELEGTGAIRGPKRDEADPGPGDHTLGICSRTPHFKSDYHNLGQIPGWRHKERGAPLKHSTHSVPCYPDIVRRSKSEASLATSPSAGAADAEGEYAAGDHTLGIRGQRPHFTPIYDDFGQIPGWKGKRFDFGPLANYRLRLTEWGRNDS